MEFDIFNKFGNYGGVIVFFLSVYLLRNHSNLLFFYTIGIFINFLLVVFLKGVIQEPRPSINSRDFELAMKNNKKYMFKDGLPYGLFGMPSGHSSTVMFSTVFVYLALRQKKWLYVYLLISAIVINQRVAYRHHTVAQVVVGSGLGALLAYVFYSLSENKLKGIIREKKDDNGPRIT
jgi:membrane-associated phospholipid phosphatase